ncbi:MAG TPA: MFS transporter, partial [Burkholderiaceae bacterium]|nr:MFS transporter [Burkholderiaceae bacterium]
YVVGMVSSPWAGRRADRMGSAPVLGWMLALMLGGMALTAFERLPAIVCGIGLFTFGFFGAHAVATAWVGRLARQARALAAATYLTAYYLGASSMGWLGGHAWSAGHWRGILAFLATLWLLAVAALARLRHHESSRPEGVWGSSPRAGDSATCASPVPGSISSSMMSRP